MKQRNHRNHHCEREPSRIFVRKLNKILKNKKYRKRIQMAGESLPKSSLLKCFSYSCKMLSMRYGTEHFCCEHSEQHPILYSGFNLDFSEWLMSLAFVLLNNTTCVTVCVTTGVLSRSRHSVLLWRTFAVWVISLSIW